MNNNFTQLEIISRQNWDINTVCWYPASEILTNCGKEEL